MTFYLLDELGNTHAAESVDDLMPSIREALWLPECLVLVPPGAGHNVVLLHSGRQPWNRWDGSLPSRRTLERGLSREPLRLDEMGWL